MHKKNCGYCTVNTHPLHKKWSFPLRISSVNVATSAVYSIANKLAGFIRGLFRAQSNIYDEAFSLKLLRAVTCSLFLQKSSVKDVRLGLKYGFGSSSDIWNVWATIEKIRRDCCVNNSVICFSDISIQEISCGVGLYFMFTPTL